MLPDLETTSSRKPPPDEPALVDEDNRDPTGLDLPCDGGYAETGSRRSVGGEEISY
jgi:hypothetical protein